MRQKPTGITRRARRDRVLALAVICCALALTACGSSNRPAATASAAATSSSPHAAAAVQFAACMRSHGVPNFRDPTLNENSAPAPAAGTVDKKSPAFRAAQHACNGFATELAAAKPRESAAQQLRYAECMRAHGVTHFPDPLPGGGFRVPSSINPQSPTFKSADRACDDKS
jgi:hypothetical protein